VERLAADRMPLAGLVLNRVHASRAARLSAERALAAAEMLNGSNGGNGGTGGNGAGGRGDIRGSDVKNLAGDGIVDHASGQTRLRKNPNSQGPATSSAEGSSPGRSPEASSPAGHASGDPHGPVGQVGQVNGQALAADLLRVHADRMRQVARESRMRARFTAVHPEVPVTEVAALPGDVHDLSGLRTIGERLADRSGTQSR
jgi:hypothetical protein